ncbi:hypothetical protein DL89DRAFT_136612 [Linderina pennispora]|uniref:Transmembrane protein n=1 Tax=Linderina pennispora TaxID=61395 RepID=A0A1Y1WAQ8_9FUNG|nr:uncharacterized protein DL89DRAFT_136612 [Linderina pennispora]ORX70629.1 hypothetical protein DL89DRAFT_136612 [Linderina pennispora]
MATGRMRLQCRRHTFSSPKQNNSRMNEKSVERQQFLPRLQKVRLGRHVDGPYMRCLVRLAFLVAGGETRLVPVFVSGCRRTGAGKDFEGFTNTHSLRRKKKAGFASPFSPLLHFFFFLTPFLFILSLILQFFISPYTKRFSDPSC